MSKNLQYITDEAGNKTAVILSIEEYEELLEDLHLTHVAEETREDERIPWEQVKGDLIAEGKLSGND
jgi:PHD/YefM family antitoxin component YafN of YafNO toxin-antitoxin module